MPPNSLSMVGGALYSEPTSANGHPDGEEPEIWSSILNGVASSKTVPSKTVLVLGDPNTGKTTLVTALQQSTAADIPAAVAAVEKDPKSKRELALSYSFSEVKDDDNEDILARVGFFRVAGLPAYETLIPFSLTLDTLLDSLVVIVLDWSRPWTFLESLERWLLVLEDSVRLVTAKKKGFLDELREKLEHSFRAYTESGDPLDRGLSATAVGTTPPATSSKPETTTASAQHSVLLPLGSGVLTNNIGVQIVVVCTKSDQTTTLERERDFKEEQFDFIQQTLRTLCLKYGAALFYVSTFRPITYTHLRSYILHKLFANTASNSQSTSPFPFKLRAQVVDRDTVLVPAGWDSWGKIKVLREGFNCEAMAGLDVAGGKVSPEAAFAASRQLYEDIIRNPSGEKLFAVNPQITAEDEQGFLERHLELLNSISGTAMSPLAASTTAPSLSDSGGLSSRLGSTTLASSDVLEDVSAKLARLNKLKEQSSLSVAARDKLKMSGSEGTSGVAAGVPTSAGVPGANQNEVLANFFQSLLSKKSSTSGVTASRPSLGRTNSLGSGALSSSPIGASNAGSVAGLGSFPKSPLKDKGEKTAS